MQARTLTIVTVLVDLKNAFLDLLREQHRNPALILTYAFIDICAALANDGETNNRAIFEACLNSLAKMGGKRFSSYDLWAARCSLLHAYSPLGHHTDKPNGARPIFYHSWPDKREEMEAVLRSKGYCDFILLDVEEVQSIAIDVLSSLLRRIDDDPAFETRFLENGQHLLFDLQTFKLEAELSMLQELGRKGQTDA